MVTIVIGNDAFPVTEKAILRVAARQIEAEMSRCNDAELCAFVCVELQDKAFLAAVLPYLSETARKRLECQGSNHVKNADQLRTTHRRHVGKGREKAN